MKNKKEFIGVCVVSIVLSLCTNITFFFLAFQTPPNAINMGVTMWWQDYFYYLSIITQGWHGAWLTHNLYTAEITAPTLLYWCNVLYGRLGYFLGMSPITTFHVANIVLGSCMLIGAYLLYKKVFPPIQRLATIAFLFFTFSTSLMNRLSPSSPVPFWPFQLWRAQHLMFERLSNTPNHLTQPVLYFLLLYLLFTPRYIKQWLRMTLIVISTILATLLHPIMIGITVIAYFIATWMSSKSKNVSDTVALVAGFIVSFAYTVIAFQGEPYIQSRQWENAQQLYTTLPFLLASIGPIVPFILVGLIVRRKIYTSLERLGVLIIFGCYTAFLLPHLTERLGILNVRFLYPGLYIFLGWFASVGLDAISQFFSRRIAIKKHGITNLLILIFFVSISPTLWWELKQKIPNVTGYPFYYTPTTTYEAFKFLEQTKPYTDVVLANPFSQTDIRVPALTGHQTVSGHPLTTINAGEKEKTAKQFFDLTMKKELVMPWITQQRITYILFTILDGNKKAFEDAYPFLTAIYTTPTATVYTIQIL